MNMREKIARAIDPKSFDFCEDMAKITGVSLDVLNPMTRTAFDRADAVLDVLMDPTEAMIYAGMEEGTYPERVFPSMIQAARDGK